MAKVTIGFPFYNNIQTIEAALQSVFAQTFQDWELLVVNDGSSDGSADIVRSISDPRVRILDDSRNKGLPARLNQIASVAKAPYIARMDADDVMHPDRIQRQLDFLQSQPHVDVVGSAMYSITSEDEVVGLRYPPLDISSPHDLFKRPPLIHVSIMAKAEWFRKNLYNESLRRAQDHELWLRTYGATQLANIQEPLVFVREQGNVSAAKFATNARASRTITKMYGPRLVGIGGTLRLLARSYGKQTAYYAAEKLGFMDRMVQRRNAEISEAEAFEAAQVLSHIAAIQLPGPALA